jgi:hypothetical protein
MSKSIMSGNLSPHHQTSSTYGGYAQGNLTFTLLEGLLRIIVRLMGLLKLHPLLVATYRPRLSVKLHPLLIATYQSSLSMKLHSLSVAMYQCRLSVNLHPLLVAMYHFKVVHSMYF